MGKKIQFVIAFAIFLKKMGWKYFAFKIYRIIISKLSIFEKRFPTTSFREISNVELRLWYEKEPGGIFLKKEERNHAWKSFDLTTSGLENRISNYKKGNKLFFKYKWYTSKELGAWNYNPLSNKEYPMVHWTKLELLNKELGDIKYIWEKSKFLEIQDYMMYDLATSQSHSNIIIENILNWIDKNPVNIGPNWSCSQEISLRLINWLMFISFYKDELYHENKTALKKIIKSILEQILHVKENINFSKIAVRNNHAFSEFLGLFLVGKMFDFIPEISKFKEIGETGFRKEFDFQIFKDGTDNQYSINYYRTKIQLISIYLNQIKDKTEFITSHQQKLNNIVKFFEVIMGSNGKVPNYGANDGSLYFRFNETQDALSFLPQIATFEKLIGSSFRLDSNSNMTDDYLWFENKVLEQPSKERKKNNEINFFPDSGYLAINKEDVFMFVRLGTHAFRPGQADNTHIDLWKKGEPILCDSGTYSYNLSTDEKNNYDFGISKFHNILVINDDNQMKSAMNFIWLNWTEVKDIIIKDNVIDSNISVSCKLIGYKHINTNLEIERTIILDYGINTINVKDQVNSLKNIEKISHNWIVKNKQLIKKMISKEVSKEVGIIEQDIKISENYRKLVPAKRYSSDSYTNCIETEIHF